MAEVDRLEAKLDEVIERLGQLHTDLEVMRSQSSSRDRDIIDLRSRVAVIEHKQVNAAIWRGWVLIAGGVLGYLLSNARAFMDWVAGRSTP